MLGLISFKEQFAQFLPATRRCCQFLKRPGTFPPGTPPEGRDVVTIQQNQGFSADTGRDKVVNKVVNKVGFDWLLKKELSQPVPPVTRRR